MSWGWGRNFSAETMEVLRQWNHISDEKKVLSKIVDIEIKKQNIV
jgi:hypothetical protein